MRDSRGEVFSTRTKVKDSFGSTVAEAVKELSVAGIPAGRYNVSFVPERPAAARGDLQPFAPEIEEMVFEDVRLPLTGQPGTVRFETLRASEVGLSFNAKKVFAIDPTALDFTRGSVRVLARCTYVTM